MLTATHSDECHGNVHQMAVRRGDPGRLAAERIRLLVKQWKDEIHAKGDAEPTQKELAHRLGIGTDVLSSVLSPHPDPKKRRGAGSVVVQEIVTTTGIHRDFFTDPGLVSPHYGAFLNKATPTTTSRDQEPDEPPYPGWHEFLARHPELTKEERGELAQFRRRVGRLKAEFYESQLHALRLGFSMAERGAGAEEDAAGDAELSASGGRVVDRKAATKRRPRG